MFFFQKKEIWKLDFSPSPEKKMPIIVSPFRTRAVRQKEREKLFKEKDEEKRKKLVKTCLLKPMNNDQSVKMILNLMSYSNMFKNVLPECTISIVNSILHRLVFIFHTNGILKETNKQK